MANTYWKSYMNDNFDNVQLKELVLDKFEKLSLKMEQLTDDFSNIKKKFDKLEKINRSFGLKSLRNSHPLTFAEDITGISSPTKKYILSMRAITEEWKGRKNDLLIVIRQQDKETSQDLKALGLRIPINDVKMINTLAKQIISLLYVVCSLKGLNVNQLLREILTDINQDVDKMVNEINTKMNL
jgi:hypothetical protein